LAKILLIEDEDLVRTGLRLTLESVGHDVYEASDGVEGVSEFKQMKEKFGAEVIVVTDLIMPGKHGYEAIADIQRLQPDAKIVAISGGGEHDPKVFLDITRSMGVQHVLAKPFDAQMLLDAVDACLQ